MAQVNRWSGHRSRAFAEWCLVALTCAALSAGITQLGWLWRIDLALYDVFMSAVPGEADPEIVIVAIDDRSLAEIGRWPWRRGVHAELLERLREAGSGPVALDVLFPEPAQGDRLDDQRLAAAIRAHGRVVLPVLGATLMGADGGRSPTAMMMQAAAAIGHSQVEFDPDGIVRSVYLWEGTGRAPHAQLALALLKLSHPERAARYPVEAASAEPWVRSGWLRIPFVGPPGTHRQVSFVDVLRGRVDAQVLRDRTVFVGAVAAGMGDRVPTPTSAFTQPMPGVEVKANVYSALMHGRAVSAAPLAAVAFGAAGVVVLMMFAVLRMTPRESLLAAFGGALGLLACSWLLLHHFRVWIPPAGAALGCMLAYPLWSWRRLEAAQRYLDEELDALHREASRWRPSTSYEPAVRAPDPIQGRLGLLRETASRHRQFRHFVIDTLEGLPTGVVVIDPLGEVLLHNKRAAALLGVSEEMSIVEAIRKLGWSAELDLREGIPQPPEIPRSLEALSAHGRNLHVSIAGLHDRRSRMHGVVLGIDDITALKQAQARREEAMQYLSHDLRAPLASIVTLVEWAAAGAPPGSDAEVLQRVGPYARTALDMTENLFRLVRAEGVDVRRFKLFDLLQIVDDASEEAWALARAKGIRIRRVENAEDECLILCEPQLLRRAVLNLLTNAIKYSPAGSEVRVLVERDPEGWRVEVIDQGEGIAPDELPQLFQRFGRLEKEGGRRVAGIGLGLMIVKTVVERHGGSVAVDSEPGRGSRFILRLPLARQ